MRANIFVPMQKDAQLASDSCSIPEIQRPRPKHMAPSVQVNPKFESLRNRHNGPCTCHLCRTTSAFRLASSETDSQDRNPIPSPSKDEVRKKSDQMSECSVCKKSIASKRGLKIHMRRHSGEQPFQCGVCGRRFAFSSSRSRHMRVHTGDKPHHCDECDRAFAASSNLSRHKRVCHSANAPSA